MGEYKRQDLVYEKEDLLISAALSKTAFFVGFAHLG